MKMDYGLGEQFACFCQTALAIMWVRLSLLALVERRFLIS